MTVNTTKPLVAKPATCDFQVLTMRPQGSYEEVASVRSAGKGVDDLGEFKNAVRSDVCRVGGDAVVVVVNNYGNILHGAVLRKVQGGS